MKRIFLFAALLFVVSNSLQAQLTQTLKKVVELKMPKAADDDMPGTRGASVVWHPVQKKYYAVMAGNAAYPLAVFDATGKRISNDDLTAMNDSRGLWYNPAKKEINGNGFGKTGWFKYVLDKKGIPTESPITLEGLNQPDEQCVGAFHPVRKEVLFLHDGAVSLYALADGSTSGSVKINWGKKKESKASEGGSEDETGGTPSAYNTTTVIYTGIKNAELGFLNTEKNTIELYDFVSGFLTKELPLPGNAVTESSFNFAYTNGIYWLFNMQTRTWTGYK
jgi:hypothetical protein